MAMPTCPHCKSHRLAITEDVPSGSSFRLLILHCGVCGAPFGALDFFNIGERLNEIEAKLEGRR